MLGHQARLEVFDGRVLVRPCPAATWGRGLGPEAWGAARLSYVAAQNGGATDGWRGDGLAEIEREIEREAEIEKGVAESAGEEEVAGEEEGAGEAAGAEAGGGAARWALRPRGLGFALALRPGSQGQLGAFPEQARRGE